MKKIIKYILVVFISGSFLNSCDTTELNLTENPNILTQGDPNLLLNTIQLGYRNNVSTFNAIGGALTRIQFMGGRDYFNNYQGATMNGIWSTTYSNIFANLQEIERINADSDINYDFHVALGKIAQAHSLVILVDMIGNAAYTEALNPVEFPAPKLDDGETIYAVALSLLDEAQALLNTNPATQGATDFYYDGDSSQWIKVINTIKLKAYKTTGNVSAFNSIITGNNFISSNEDDLQFTYGTNQLQPDTRHPDYASDYTPSGANLYRSNWTMETMLMKDDPRIRYYFYRQVDGTPGALDINGDPVDPNEETLACSLVVPPQHYIDGGYTYCSVDNGYWGRSHGNDEGTPPDGFTRTASGVYPAGGRFDDNSFGEVGLGVGGGGAGIEPMLLASWVDFWRAEMAATDAERGTFMEAGMTKSIAKVQTFGALDGTADKSFEPTADEVSDYIEGIVAEYNAATGDDKENVFAEQYWIALYGGGGESWNYYRKTGFPTTVLPNWEPDPGAFPRTLLLPQNEVVTNPNLTQRTSLTTQVFWDTNPASPAFPPAN
ncbi:Susd and RagB outer membrane lipoprotein [Maribacter sedimenticola]|uniref:Susd and RagB outer membrane lipoprotein n=1 Tax=Maribacter sedimenticola TaxID=228956 RepID=A0ABY1SE51_9FLAO|nr:SusD/RagB family nutrient-binding outer membrane lipoprotein [Maribacter sedimenticola]SNR29558.1 Susd and RagB outer membrane lipoprotein [Maribacter sedimenticola]